MGTSVEKIRDIYKISQEPVSLETPIGEEDDSHLGDFVPDEHNMSPEDYAANELLKDENMFYAKARELVDKVKENDPSSDDDED